MGIVAVYGWSKGNPAKYLSGVDSDGKFCGYDAGYGDYNKLYFPDISSTANIQSMYVCIKGGCPVADGKNIDCKTTTSFPNCNPGGSIIRYNTTQYLGKYCLPKESELPASLKGSYNAIVSWLQLDLISQWISDVLKAWPILVISLFLALIFCLLFMYLIEWFAAILAWVCIIASFLFLVALGFFFWFNKDSDKNKNSNNSTYNIIWASLCWAGALAIFLFVCCFCKALRIAIGVIQASADFITDTKRILLVPIAGFIYIVLFYIFWISVAVFVYTIGNITSSGGQGKRVEWDNTTRRAWYYHFFGLFWINAFLDAFISFIIIVAASTWYFSHGTEIEGTAQVYKGLRWIWRYHFGSLALGSFILAVVQAIKYTFEYVRNRLNNANPTNAALRFILCLVSYCISCLNRCIKFITKNAYVQVALTSNHFCLSAFNAFILILRNGARFIFVEWISFLFAIMGKIMVISLICLINYFILTMWTNISDDLSSFFPVIFIAGVISYAICTVFFDVFSIAGNTILQCFILDYEISNSMGRGSAGHQPPALKKFIKQIRQYKRDRGDEVSDSHSDRAEQYEQK